MIDHWAVPAPGCIWSRAARSQSPLIKHHMLSRSVFTGQCGRPDGDTTATPLRSNVAYRPEPPVQITPDGARPTHQNDGDDPAPGVGQVKPQHSDMDQTKRANAQRPVLALRSNRLPWRWVNTSADLSDSGLRPYHSLPYRTEELVPRRHDILRLCAGLKQVAP